MGPQLIEFSLFFSENLGNDRQRIYLGPFKAIAPKGQIMIMRAKNRILTFTPLPSPPLQETVPNMQYFPLYLGSMKSNSFSS